jgi:cytochrome d ubiquinol oxidase subunit II
MTTVWFCLLAFMIAVYVVLDGFDLGVGALHRILGRTDEERTEATGLIGPVWDGNEVWLIAAGGVLFLGFPKAYAAAFSGFYFGLIIILWLLVGRGLGIEFRKQSDNPLWRIACDTVFWLSSAGLAFMFGVALGNVVRGVPLGPDGYFRGPLFSLLNWYALLVGLFGFVVLVTHGATFLAARAGPALAQRAGRVARRFGWAELLLVAALGYPTYLVRNGMITSFGDHPWRLVFPVLALAGLGAQQAFQHRRSWGRALPQHPSRAPRSPLRPHHRQRRVEPPRAHGGPAVVVAGDRPGDRLLHRRVAVPVRAAARAGHRDVLV